MILYLDIYMSFIDIHTHHLPTGDDVVAILNVIVGENSQHADRGDCYLSYGLHPWNIESAGERMERLRLLVEGDRVVAIGEAGLDRLAESPIESQIPIFISQAELAESVAKPLIIHCVKAWDELLAIKKRMRPSQPWIIHGFRGNGVMAAQLLRQGFYLSFGRRHNPDALRAAWPDCLFLESDEEDINIGDLYAEVANKLNIPLADFKGQVSRNCSIFNLFRYDLIQIYFTPF